MAWTGVPITLNGATVLLGGVELGLGGSTAFSLSISGSSVDLPVFGDAPYKSATTGADIQGSGSIDYVMADGELVEELFTRAGAQTLLVTLQTDGFVFTANIIINNSEFTVDTSGVVTGSLTYVTTGSFTLTSAAIA